MMCSIAGGFIALPFDVDVFMQLYLASKCKCI